MARIILMTDFSEAYARNLLLGMARYTHDIGEPWSICRVPTSLRDKFGLEYIVDYACKMRADAIIGQFYENDDITLFKKKGIIAIAQDFKKKFSLIRNITGEYRLSGKMAAEYFIKKGFRNFAFYGISNVIWSEERFEGFKEAILEANPNYFISDLRPPKTDLWEYDFKEITHWLKSLPKPIAIMACDDNQAYNITEACHLMQIKKEGETFSIPEDIAVLGVDNDETICNLCSPPLSSISQDVESGGYYTAKMIDRQIKYNKVMKEDIIVRSTHIVTRRSSDIFVNDDPVIAKVLKFIHENISYKISVQDILEETPMSRRLLEIRFRKTMGTSIYDYIIKIRIARISHLLSEGKTVSEAAFEVGQSDIKNISRIFKRLNGVTPSEYRKKKFSK